MRIFGIDTCSDAVSVASMKDGVLEGQIFLHVSKKHSETLLPEAQSLLNAIGCTLQDVDKLGVSVGPGSFTGVRIGAATMSAVAYILNLPVYAVSTLDALLALCPKEVCSCAMLDARRNQVYVKAVAPTAAASSDPTLTMPLIEQSAMALEEVFERLKGEPVVLFTGDGAMVHRREIMEAMPGALIYPESASWPTAVGVCACVAVGNASLARHDTLRPVYLRVPQAERERLERLQRDTDSKTKS